jgi:hypothetical protein
MNFAGYLMLEFKLHNYLLHFIIPKLLKPSAIRKHYLCFEFLDLVPVFILLFSLIVQFFDPNDFKWALKSFLDALKCEIIGVLCSHQHSSSYQSRSL